jgi:hypothetical protein
MRDTPLRHVAAVIFAAQGLAHLVLFGTGRQFAGFTWEVHIVNLALAAVWLVTALSLVLRVRRAWYLQVVAALVSVLHGAVLLVPGNTLAGLLFVAAGAATARIIVPRVGMRLGGWRGSEEPEAARLAEEPGEHELGWPQVLAH